MEKIATVLEYQNKKYFGVGKSDSLLLSEYFKGSFLKGGALGPEECLRYEILRKDSVIVCGDVFNSDYFKRVVFHVSYSELSSYGQFVDQPPDSFEARVFEIGDELVLHKHIPEGAVYGSIMDMIESRNSLHSIIDGCTQRFLNTCKQTGVHVTLSVSPRPVLITEHPGNIRIVDCFAL